MTRLTEEMVIARSKQSDLGNIKKLNCWGSELSDVSIIKRMRGVEVLALSVNRINTLQHFEDCRNLQELYLRKNNIQDLSEIVYLQNLPRLKYLWLEENPCCDKTGPSYRSYILRALPNLKKLDNVEVTPEEVEEALNGAPARVEEEEDEPHHQQQSQQQPYQQQQQYSQQPQQYASQQALSSSPVKERSPTNHQDYSPPEQAHPPSPKYNQPTRENRLSYTQYDQRSPGSDQESPLGGYRERGPIPASISTHSMKEYYQSDRPSYPAHYRHSQTDLTEWEEHQQHNNHHYTNGTNGDGGRGGSGSMPRGGNPMERRSAGAVDREISDRYNYRNGNVRENSDWDDRDERPRTASRRPEGRFNDSASVVSTAVLNHYSYHRRPINRSSNLLSATLCLVKELDYPSLEVVEHAVRCRIEELSAD